MDHPLLHRYRQILSYQPFLKHIAGDTFLILNVWELYFFVLLNKIKQFKAKDRRPKPHQRVSPEQSQLEARQNPLLLLLRRYLGYFCCPTYSSYSTSYPSHSTKADKLLFLVEDLLASEFTLPALFHSSHWMPD